MCTLLLIAVGSLSPLLSLIYSCVFVHRIAKTDDFVRRLMEIYQEVLSTGDKQVSVGSGSLICYFLCDDNIFMSSVWPGQAQAGY